MQQFAHEFYCAGMPGMRDYLDWGSCLHDLSPVHKGDPERDEQR